jgi:hypothetical protein
MESWKSAADEWLRQEHLNCEDEAEANFAAILTVLADAQPPPAFAVRATRAAWAVRTGPRRIRTWAAAVAVVLAAVFGNPAAFGVLTGATGWLVAATSLAAYSAVQVIVAAVTAWTWSSIVIETGATVAVVALSQGAAVLATLAVTGAMALYLMQRLLRGDFTTRHPGPLCV